ncbi:MAG: hypothetical protein MUF75_01945 [Bacteroidia bacterium]|jgi:hypothetical protein|nr:hypothetical protein [Bacteroidia bacterium]
MKIVLICVIVLSGLLLQAQVYVEKQSRHRFAQLNLGWDVQSSTSGNTKYIDTEGNIQSLILNPHYRPRFIIGGTHFWGHADFYIAIPLTNSQTEKNKQIVKCYNGVETGFKFYPFRIENQKLRPYLGLALSGYYLEQHNKNFQYGNGPELTYSAWPLLAGFTFNHKSHLFEAGMVWNYKNKQVYFISREIKTGISTPALYFQLGYKHMLETTLSAEKDWESGTTEKITIEKANKKELNNLYFAAGISAVFCLQESSYNQNLRPYINKYPGALLADLSLGYYFHKPDLNIGASYRAYSDGTDSYGALQKVKRKSLALESAKILFDYHGFVPFVGPSISYEQLSFEEEFEQVPTQQVSKNQMAYGILFGWDIRPNRLQSILLRTNLRWFPKINLNVEGGHSISFANLEFNFIQLVVYPGRMF